MKKLLTLSLILTLAFFAGCSEQPIEPEETGQFNLESEFGGFDASSEEPRFGDAALLASDAGDLNYDDPILTLSMADSLVRDMDARLFHLRMVWGKLRYDSTITEQTDWSGSLSITRGAFGIRKVIQFEEGQDELLARLKRQLIEWKSFTTVHHDGLAIDILVPRELPTIDSIWVIDTLSDSMLIIDTLWPEPVTVSFETGPYSRTFTLRELASLDTVIYLDDSNAIAFHGFQIDRIQCPRGFLNGQWGFDDSGNGRFRGTWTDQHGRITGHLTGHFGRKNSDSRNARRVFFGKWIAPDGRFEGFLRGTWEPHPNYHADQTAFEHAGGKFNGSIYTAERRKIGALKGIYRSADSDGRGFFQGRWKLLCSDDNDGDRDGSGDRDYNFDHDHDRDRNCDNDYNPDDGFDE